ncbi:MAG: hypothetical protein V1737_00835, partial [Chloroflexota bacterium]
MQPDAGESLDVTLQGILDSVEDELVVIGGDYRVRFANSAARGKLPKPDESPIGKLCYEALHN